MTRGNLVYKIPGAQIHKLYYSIINVVQLSSIDNIWHKLVTLLRPPAECAF